MRKSDILIVVLGATTLISFCGCAYNRNTSGYSMAQATAQPSYGHQRMTQTASREVASTSSRREKLAAVAETGASDFSRRLQGGTLLRFESGLIVVEPANLRGSLQPTALTTDAIITSSVRSKIADQSQLRTRSFEVQTDNGIVTIRAKEESLEDAVAVINLALGIPDVRQIVYTMPASV
ncbi:MAG: BON domain-containing protein [Verrucomicrobia bacterium]|nr:BON domain-containing protein [Verrucomicrobiota bacterium]